MKKILLSLLTIGAVSAAAIGASRAFFSDVETSTGNTFTSGVLDLKVDNTCHHWTDTDANGQYDDVGCPSTSNWTSTDLGATHKFFDFTDVKPGEYGEDTISLTVDNDAWLRLVVTPTANVDNSCTEPENTAEGGIGCGDVGELQQNLLFSMWLDQGADPGFQGQNNDATECDNIQADIVNETSIITEGPIDTQGETWDLADYGGAYLKSNETACFGVAWSLPSGTGNEIQSDSFVGNMEFQVQQHRNNPTPTW